MADYASSVRRAALQAGRLHRDLAIQSTVVRGSGRVDVYDTIARLNVPLFFTRLDGLLGVYALDRASREMALSRHLGNPLPPVVSQLAEASAADQAPSA